MSVEISRIRSSVAMPQRRHTVRAAFILNSGIRFAFSGIRSMAGLLSRLPTQVSHDNMPDQPPE
jgi:hypothetical protein